MFILFSNIIHWISSCVTHVSNSIVTSNTHVTNNLNVIDPCYPSTLIQSVRSIFVYTLPYIVNKIIHVPFFTLCTVIDSLICSTHFLHHYFNTKNINNISNLYSFHFIERYIIYFIVYVTCVIPSKGYISYTFILITLPFIQNKLYCSSYVINRRIFIKYNLAKCIVYGIQNLHTDIINIQNYQMFLIYNYIEPLFIWNIIKSYLFVSLLYFLRNSNQTSLYYYYKAIKAAYYCETGYLFNTTTTQDSVYLFNIIIKEQRWQDIKKLELINALYILVHSKNSIPLYYTCYLYYMFFFCLWTCLYSIFTFYSIQLNSLITSLICITFPIYYIISKELVFYIMNKHNIKKVIKKYNIHTQDDFEFIQRPTN